MRCTRGDIAVFRTQEDKVFAVFDKCPHKGGPLSQGIVHGEQVTCPLHAWKINLIDGKALEPDEGQVACLVVKVEDAIVYLEL